MHTYYKNTSVLHLFQIVQMSQQRDQTQQRQEHSVYDMTMDITCADLCTQNALICGYNPYWCSVGVLLLFVKAKVSRCSTSPTPLKGVSYVCPSR